MSFVTGFFVSVFVLCFLPSIWAGIQEKRAEQKLWQVMKMKIPTGSERPKKSDEEIKAEQTLLSIQERGGMFFTGALVSALLIILCISLAGP